MTVRYETGIQMGIFTCKKVGFRFWWNLSLFIKVALKVMSKNVVFGD